MSEREDAYRLATKLLDESSADPDDDRRMLARQLMRHKEWLEKAKADLAASYDPHGDLVNANRDAIMDMQKEAIRRVRKCLEIAAGHVPHDGKTYQAVKLSLDILGSLNLFHPMHGESWKGWPEGS